MPQGSRGTLKNKYAIMLLCGWRETTGNVSTPPKVYTKMTATYSGTSESQPQTYTCGDPDDPDEPSQSITYIPNTTVSSGSQSIESTFATATSSNLCSYGTPQTGDIGSSVTTRNVGDPEGGPYGCGNKVVRSHTSTYGPTNVFSGTIQYNHLLRFGGWFTSQGSIDSSVSASTFTPGYSGGRTQEYTISVEDTDEAVIERTTLIELPNSGSISAATPNTLWETRSTGASFEYQQCEFRIECKSLNIGLTYKADATVRRRTAVIGSYGAWSDVSFTPVQFVATDTDQMVPGDNGGGEAQYFTLPQVQGYEYEITDVDCYLA